MVNPEKLNCPLWTPEQVAYFEEALGLFKMLKDGNWAKPRKKMYQFAYDVIEDIVPRLFNLKAGDAFDYILYCQTQWPGREKEVLDETLPYLTGAKGLLDFGFTDEIGGVVEPVRKTQEEEAGILICSVDGKEVPLQTDRIFVKVSRNQTACKGEQ